MELRQRLKHQLHARARSELEASRNLPQQVFQQASGMPMSSRTSETGWEHASHGGVMSFSRGAEVRSPEIGTRQHSPMNRAKIVSGV